MRVRGDQTLCCRTSERDMWALYSHPLCSLCFNVFQPVLSSSHMPCELWHDWKPRSTCPSSTLTLLFSVRLSDVRPPGDQSTYLTRGSMLRLSQHILTVPHFRCKYRRRPITRLRRTTQKSSCAGISDEHHLDVLSCDCVVPKPSIATSLESLKDIAFTPCHTTLSHHNIVIQLLWYT